MVGGRAGRAGGQEVAGLGTLASLPYLQWWRSVPEVPHGEQLEYLSEGPTAAASEASPASTIHSIPDQEERRL